ncbi:MAG: hypothetical protein GY870_19935, partial [archaeon]|nr:hypothetical protein [archaeon]
MFKKPGKDQDIVEESIFGANQFDELIDWSLDRRNFEIYCNITGKWLLNDKFFKGRGKLLKKYDGSIFSDSIYILLEEGDLGKEDILIGRKVTIIK